MSNVISIIMIKNTNLRRIFILMLHKILVNFTQAFDKHSDVLSYLLKQHQHNHELAPV